MFGAFGMEYESKFCESVLGEPKPPHSLTADSAAMASGYNTCLKSPSITVPDNLNITALLLPMSFLVYSTNYGIKKYLWVKKMAIIVLHYFIHEVGYANNGGQHKIGTA